MVSKNTACVTINDTNLNQITYQGQPVVTFEMIDRVHERPYGTAGRNFRANRERFIEGDDYFKVCADDIRRHKIMDISPKAHEDFVLLTQMGYLMLAKSLTDDLSWRVQRELVNNYFAIATPPAQAKTQKIALKYNLSFFGELSRADLPKKSYHLGVVYALELDNGYVKIGHTTRPDGRITELEKSYRAFANANRLVISKECVNYADAEKQLHNKFANQRVEGEIFQVEIFDVVDALCELKLEFLHTGEVINRDFMALAKEYESIAKLSTHLREIYQNIGFGGGELYIAIDAALRAETGKKFLEKAFYPYAWLVEEQDKDSFLEAIQ